MKKILSLFILFLSVGLFAETGYAGVEWGTKKEQLKDFFIEHDDSELWNNTEVREKQILNEKTKVYYHFFYDRLISISYKIPDKKTEKLLSKFPDVVDVMMCPTMTLTEFKELHKDAANLNLDDSNILETLMNQNVAQFVERYEITQMELPNGKGKIWIFDYNNDTNAYLIQDIIEGYTFVVYVFREQDY